MARYKEIADDLRRRIQRGDFPLNSRLPGINNLQREYDVPGLNTIRAAQQILVDEGMLETRQGVGVFVRSTEPVREINLADELGHARDALTRVITAMEAPGRKITFDLDADDTYFVLTEALRDFIRHQRQKAEDADDRRTAASRLNWAATAETALERVEAAQ